MSTCNDEVPLESLGGVLGLVLGLIVTGVGAMFVAAETDLDIGGIGLTYAVTGIVLLVVLAVGLGLIGYFWLTQLAGNSGGRRGLGGR